MQINQTVLALVLGDAKKTQNAQYNYKLNNKSKRFYKMTFQYLAYFTDAPTKEQLTASLFGQLDEHEAILEILAEYGSIFDRSETLMQIKSLVLELENNEVQVHL